MNAVLGNVVRPVGLTTFADITDAPLVLDAGRVDRNGLLFDGDLSPEQVEAIWFRMTSRDDADEANRRALKAAMDDGATNLDAMNTAYRLGLPLPAPTFPAPAPAPAPIAEQTISAASSKVASLAKSPRK